jgi:hypothetical protein
MIPKSPLKSDTKKINTFSIKSRCQISLPFPIPAALASASLVPKLKYQVHAAEAIIKY